MPSVHLNESAITRTDSDSLMKTPLNNALTALNREHTLSQLQRENTTCKFKSIPTLDKLPSVIQEMPNTLENKTKLISSSRRMPPGRRRRE